MVKDDDGLYRGECGGGLSEEQFEAWVKQQGSDTQVIIVEVTWDMSEETSGGKAVTFKVDNHADKNGLDLLKQYEESLENAAGINLAARVAQLQRDREGAE